MHDPDLREYEELLAARYVLGVATRAEIAQVHARFETGGGFVERVAAFCEFFSDVELSGDTLEPPPEVWNRIETAIDDLEKLPAPHITPTPVTRWEPVAPGIQCRPLQMPHSSGHALYRVAAGACFPAQNEILADECLLIDGEIEIGGVTMKVGDFASVQSRERAGAIKSRTGALLYVRTDSSPHS